MLMKLKKNISIIAVIMVTCVSGLWAGDTASFVDLGFSPDGKSYMFGQYGVLSPALKPWAEIFVVDVAGNDFVPNGKFSFTDNVPISAGQDGSGVFYRLVSANSETASRHGINFQNQGQPLYISLDKNPPDSGETIEFRDFVFDKKYRAELVSSVQGKEQNIKSSFFINLESRTGNGQVKKYTIGNPRTVRAGVASYNIKKVLIDANGDSIIFVIEMKRFSDSGYNIRYMIEAQRL
ncbi:MAG: DUF2259 domain-containing protein [Treponema sp.]|jgi:predicted secreted protein|nr:DUF2259 domain-containing protein [Treponema sp.]